MNKEMPKQLYFESAGAVAERILERSVCIVLCSEEDTAQIIGYVVFGSGPVLHYVYVKQPFRRMGLGRHLVREVVERVGGDRGLPCSHMAANVDIWQAMQKEFDFIFNPYLRD
jgi:GNAT superfamily N-acetyltransferase